ncbi:hypothetical protein [Cystobacter fuscus]|uniref:nSTAND3 domain-containing NTPase n=1 Tax=Cystobacter fuscus TaxID=43 RepID=UPI002B2D2A1E|nr:hypothetical protein F0U63_01165 [Cystobacter fuscus]
MSIATTSTAAYTYQYEADVWFFLLHAGEPGLMLVNEPRGSEDAKATFPAIPWNVEIQSKSERGDVDIPLLLGWLWKFPEREASDSLLERLLSNLQSSALFFTGGRCTDSVRRLVSDGTNTVGEREFGLERAEAGEFLRMVSNVAEMPERTRLEQERRAHRSALVLSLNDVFRLTRRIHVLEGVTREHILAESRRLLVRHRVPTSQADHVFRRMVDYVREKVPDRDDVAPGLRKLLRESAKSRIFNEEAERIERPEESALLDRLQDKRVLLLTGPSRCGKTFLAKWLAQALQNLGFEIGRGDSQDAMRFLLLGNEYDRLFIIENAFEQATASGTVRRTWEAVEQVIRELSEHCRLIVTASKESLRDTLDANGIPIPMEGHPWVDLTVRDPALADRIWRKHAGLAGLSEVDRERYSEHLRRLSPDFLVQPGQLWHLARNFPKGETRLDALDRKARVNAIALAVEVRSEPEMARLVRALGISMTATRPIHLDDLAFLMTDREDRPGLGDSKAGGLVSTGIESTPFPTYSPPPRLPQPDSLLLDDLERRGWIRRDGDLILFAHPDYEEAARSLLAPLPQGQRRDLWSMLERAIVGLGVNAAPTATRMLARLFEEHKSEDDRQRLLRIGLDALHSIFPAASDEALLFLLSQHSRLDKADQEMVWSWLANGGRSGAVVSFHRGQAWFAPQTSWSEMFRDLMHADDALSPTELDTPEKAWRALQGSSTLAVVEHGLRFPEVFIRAKAAKRYMSLASRESERTWRAILDDHPLVLAAAFKGAIRNWPSYSPELQQFLLEGLTRAASVPLGAAALSWTMWRFESECEEGSAKVQGERWQLWGALLPTFLDAAPPLRWTLREDTLYGLFHQARQYLSQDLQRDICWAWLRWVKRELRETLPSGDTLAVADFLLEVVPTDSTERGSLLPELLQHEDTGFTLINVRAFIDHWDNLLPVERDAVRALVTGARKDRQWIRAAALTSRSVPSALVEAICGQTDALGLSPAELEKVVSTEFFVRCLEVSFGNPQRLGWLGMQSGIHPVWRAAAGYVRSQPTHAAFGRAWRAAYLVGDEDPDALLQQWQALCTGTKPEDLELLFEVLITLTAIVNTDLREYWSALWSQNSTDEQRVLWSEQLASQLEDVCRFQSPPELFEDEALFSMVLSRVHPDRVLLTAMVQLKESVEGFSELVTVFYSSPERTPRLIWTHDLVLERLKELGAEKDLQKQVGAVRHAAFNRRTKSFRVERDIDGEDWIFSHRAERRASDESNGSSE